MPKQNLLYVGVKGSVIAYDKDSGQQVWATALTGSMFVNVILDGDRLFAHSYGELFALDAASGHILWRDGLKGYGFGHASLVTVNAPNNGSVLLAQQLAEEESQQGHSAAPPVMHS